MTLHPKLLDFVNKLGELMVFINPEHRPSIIPKNDYEPFDQEGMPVQAVIIGNKRLAAFVCYVEGNKETEEVIRLEEIDPIRTYPDVDDPSLLTNCGNNYYTAYAAIQVLLSDFATPYTEQAHK